MGNDTVIKQLNSINWNFDFTINYSKDVLRPFNCRKYYSYPATFIPEIPYALIEILSSKGDVVLDPYGGIGTTFMQALILERRPYSFDINPIATSVCQTLYALFNPEIDYEYLSSKLESFCSGYNENIDYTDSIIELRIMLRDWFEGETFNQLAFLFKNIDEEEDEIAKCAAELIISSILVPLSSQNKGWAYIADNVRPKPDELRTKSVFYQYATAVKVLIEDLRRYRMNLPDDFKSFYKELACDSRVIASSVVNSKIRQNTVHLVITSPPYPKMIDYIKSQRLSFNYRNIKYEDYMDLEVGARYRRSKKSFLDEYLCSIQEINEKVVNLLKDGGYLCVVLPDYESSDSRKDIISQVIAGFEVLNLTKIAEMRRYIPSHKRTLSIQWATLVNESIYVFQKG